MKKLIVGTLALLLLLLSACGAPVYDTPAPTSGPAETPAPTSAPEPSPEPTPAPTPLPTTLVLTDESAEEILAYASWTQLERVDATASREYDALLQLQEALPDCRVEWRYELGGESYGNLDTTALTLDSTEGLAEGLRYLPRVTDVDLLAAAVPDEEKDALMAAYPEVDFLWMVHFVHWDVRSDLLAFSTLVGPNTPAYTDEDFAPLFKYCRHLKALDLGHNDLRDLSLLGTLTELQVLILADNEHLTDISPLANLTELRYLELFSCLYIEDFSALKSLTKMENLNLCFEKKLDDASIFDNMPNLKMAWLRSVKLTEAEKQALIAAHPDAEFSFDMYREVGSATDGGWRATDENLAVRMGFRNYMHLTAYDYWEGIEFDPEAELVQLTPLWT